MSKKGENILIRNDWTRYTYRTIILYYYNSILADIQIYSRIGIKVGRLYSRKVVTHCTVH